MFLLFYDLDTFSFLSFFFWGGRLISLARTSSSVQNMSSQSGHLVLFCLRGKAFNLSLLSVVSCRLVIYGFTVLRYILCRFNLLRDFIINRH